jgi:hypothetical protein
MEPSRNGLIPSRLDGSPGPGPGTLRRGNGALGSGEVEPCFTQIPGIMEVVDFTQDEDDTLVYRGCARNRERSSQSTPRLESAEAERGLIRG